MKISLSKILSLTAIFLPLVILAALSGITVNGTITALIVLIVTLCSFSPRKSAE